MYDGFNDVVLHESQTSDSTERLTTLKGRFTLHTPNLSMTQSNSTATHTVPTAVVKKGRRGVGGTCVLDHSHAVVAGQQLLYNDGQAPEGVLLIHEQQQAARYEVHTLYHTPPRIRQLSSSRTAED